MNVNVIGLRLRDPEGPKPHAGTTPAHERLTDARAEKVIANVARAAWFDFNGDGKIENSNPLYGGDGTLLGFKDSPARPRDVQEPRSHVSQAVVDHARDTYTRYSHTEKPAREAAPKAHVA